MFVGADLEEAIAAARTEFGPDADVRAARSVKQGLRGRTHVEVLVGLPAGTSGATPASTAAPATARMATPAIPAAPAAPVATTAPAATHPSATGRADADPVESTLAALLASAEAEEQALLDAERAPASVVPFEAQQLPGNPSFAAEFASAFPAALAAAKADADRSAPARDSVASGHELEDFTARVRDALRRVPQAEDDTDEFVALSQPVGGPVAHPVAQPVVHPFVAETVVVAEPVMEPELVEPEDVEPVPVEPVPVEAVVVERGLAERVVAAVAEPVAAPPARPHPAPGLFDEPSLRLPGGPALPTPPPTVTARGASLSYDGAVPVPPPVLPPNERLQDAVAAPALPSPTPPVASSAGERPSPRPRPTPGAAATGRPASLRPSRPAAGVWSAVRLRGLGVPEQVLAAMPEQEPTEDLHWLVALTDAIAATVPAPVVDGDADVTATGRGLRGALALLRLGVTGVAPCMLVVDGRAVPATATELALTIRSAIVR